MPLQLIAAVSYCFLAATRENAGLEVPPTLRACADEMIG